MNRKIWSVCLIMILLLSLSLQPQVSRAEAMSAYSLSVSAATPSVNQEITVTLKGDGLADLYGYEAVIEYDAGKLSFMGADSSVSGAGFSIAPIVSGNSITFAFTKMGKEKGISGSADLGTFRFKASAVGSAEVKLVKLTAVTPDNQATRWNEVRTVSAQIIASDSGQESSPGSGSSSGYTPAGPVVEKSANGVVIAFPAPVKAKTTDGKDSAVASVSKEALAQAVKSLQDSAASRIEVRLEGKEPVAQVELPAASLLEAAKELPGAVISVKYGTASYDLPLAALDLAELAQTMKTDIGNVKVTVQLETVSGPAAEQLSSIVRQTGGTLLGSAVKFDVLAAAGGTSVTIGDFGGVYISRTLEVQAGVDARKATGVLFDPATGELSFVPTMFQQASGGTVATLKRPGNSMYAVIGYNKSFADLSGHWAKADVELLASKLLVNGRTEQQFAPQGEITRAEFAALLVRGLGLSPAPSAASFKDVAAADWFAGYIGAAVKAGLVEGMDAGLFAPKGLINREQMAVMISRAIQTAGKPLAAGVGDLGMYSDESQISGWAKTAVSQAVEAGLMNGVEPGLFSPASNATRAETATVLKRLLQYVEFMNETTS